MSTKKRILVPVENKSIENKQYPSQQKKELKLEITK
jgi:hypothetical protein